MLGAERRGKVGATGGYFGAVQLAALLLEKTTEQLSPDEAEALVRPRRASR